MAARLQHHRAAQVVVVLARLATLVEDRRAGEVGIAARDDAHRLAGHVHVGVAQDR